MSDLSLLLAFIAAASVLTVTPGVDTAMVLRATATGGRRSAAMASLGIVLGCLVWGAAVSLGLGVGLPCAENCRRSLSRLVGRQTAAAAQDNAARAGERERGCLCA